LNQTVGSSDFLIQAQLTGAVYNVQPAVPKLYWRVAPQ
jgi:hypothetical protein